MTDFRNFINGAWVATDKTFDNRDPVDNRLIGRIHEAGDAEVDAAVRAAKAALRGPWGKLKTQQRVELLHAVADGIIAASTTSSTPRSPTPASPTIWPAIWIFRAARRTSRSSPTWCAISPTRPSTWKRRTAAMP